MTGKTIIELKRAVQVEPTCLPHAAMNLGTARGVGVRPIAGLVSRLVIEEQMGHWMLYRMDTAGGYVGDSPHPSREDALRQARREFGRAMRDVL